MGQKKTWGHHHIPVSMLWENMQLAYNAQWSPTLQTKIVEKKEESQFDKKTNINNFNFCWKTPFVSMNANNKKIARNSFVWIENANKGTNETSNIKTNFFKIQEQFFLLNYFFKEIFKKKIKKNIKYNLNRAVISFIKKKIWKKQIWTRKRFKRRTNFFKKKTIINFILKFKKKFNRVGKARFFFKNKFKHLLFFYIFNFKKQFNKKNNNHWFWKSKIKNYLQKNKQLHKKKLTIKKQVTKKQKQINKEKNLLKQI